MRTLRATFGRATAVLRALSAGGWSGVNSQPPWCCWGVMFGIAAPEPHPRHANAYGRYLNMGPWAFPSMQALRPGPFRTGMWI